MTRLAIILCLLVAFAAGAFYLGTRWQIAEKERARADTLERIQNADTSEGNPDDDRGWIADFVSGLLPAD